MRMQAVELATVSSNQAHNASQVQENQAVRMSKDSQDSLVQLAGKAFKAHLDLASMLQHGTPPEDRMRKNLQKILNNPTINSESLTCASLVAGLRAVYTSIQLLLTQFRFIEAMGENDGAWEHVDCAFVEADGALTLVEFCNVVSEVNRVRKEKLGLIGVLADYRI